MNIPFFKMHGAGNDFVIIDGREGIWRAQKIKPTPEQVRHIASRKNQDTGGCDQVIVIESEEKEADVFMRIYNADGSEANACGNATRCVAWLIIREQPSNTVSVQMQIGNRKEEGRRRLDYEPRIRTHAGVLKCTRLIPDDPDADATIEVDMGAPKFAWQDIPLSIKVDNTLEVDVFLKRLPLAGCVGMGNPHAVFFEQDVELLHEIERVGPELQKHALFQKHGINVTIAIVDPRNGIFSRVWERGAGLTASCGTAACASVAVAIKKGYLENNGNYISVTQNNGIAERLQVRWNNADGHIYLSGPVQYEFGGELTL